MRAVCLDNRLFYSYYTNDRSGLQVQQTIQKYGNVRSDNLGSSGFLPRQYNSRQINDGGKLLNI